MKLDLARKLLAPINYLRISHDEKTWIDLYVPLMIAAVSLALIAAVPGQVSIVGKDGFIDGLNGLLQILTGFYIAALAAVSTFDSKGMDDLMEGKPPTIYERRKGTRNLVKLTRRRFLCYLFGYLALLCFALFALGLMANLLVPALDVRQLLGNFYTYVRYALLFAYLLALGNMVTTTLLGLYYLTVKIHIQNPEPIHDKDR